MKTNQLLFVPLLFFGTLLVQAQNIQPDRINLNLQNTMKAQEYSTTFTVSQSPAQVFQAINNVRGWWSEQIEGRTDALNEVFNYHYQDVHRCKMKIVEFIPDKKVVWLVEDNYFNFIRDQSEWKNTKISFEITKKDDQTELVFTHIGLKPADECYDICSDSWGNYINGSLKLLITQGKGNPNPYQHAIQNAEKKKNQGEETTTGKGKPGL